MKPLRLLISNREINQAGDVLLKWKVEDGDVILEEAFEHIAAFRLVHAYPLRAVTTILRQRAISVDPSANVYGRTKRMTSIVVKLIRNTTMQVTTMQNIGGCRAVVNSMQSVNELTEQFRRIAPRLEGPREYNYVQHPKPDGYRSVHFVVRFQSRHA